MAKKKRDLLKDQDAFPNDGVANSGMSLRDYFAARALPIYLAHFAPTEGFSQLQSCEITAEWSYAMADAMLKVREQ